MIVIIFITLAYAFIRGLFFIYLYQIKEYRVDRLLSRIRENGILDTFYITRNRMPGISFRNFLIVSFLGLSCSIVFLMAIENKIIYYSLSFLVFFAPFLGFLFVSIAVILTEIPVSLYRFSIILRARQKVRNSKTIFIGITGTYGKTSIKEYLSFLLAAKYNVAKTEKNMNTGVGIAIGINRYLTDTTDFFITEVGSYCPGETWKATWYIPFTYGILTGLGNQHIDLYGSKKALVQEETSLLARIPESGHVYLNHQISDHKELSATIKAKQITYGFHNTSCKAKILTIHTDFTKAQITYRGYSFTITTKLPGEHSILNLLPVISLAMDCGMKPGEIVQRIAQLQPVEGKLSVHSGKAKAIILNDAVNSNVDGFLAALTVLNRYPQKTKYVLSQGIIELGVEKRTSYERILQEISRNNIKLFTTDPFFKKLTNSDSVITFNDVSQMRDKIVTLMNKHTVILLEGKFPEGIVKQIMNQS